VRRKLEDARYCCRWRRRHTPGTQTEPQLEVATSAGIILPETGQFLLLCSLQLWQQLQRCRQTRARVQVFLTHFTSILRQQFAVNNTFLREANGYKRVLVLRNWRQVSLPCIRQLTQVVYTLLFSFNEILPQLEWVIIHETFYSNSSVASRIETWLELRFTHTVLK